MRPVAAAGLAVLAFAAFLVVGSMGGASPKPGKAGAEAVAATPQPAGGAAKLPPFGSVAPVPGLENPAPTPTPKPKPARRVAAPRAVVAPAPAVVVRPVPTPVATVPAPAPTVVPVHPAPTATPRATPRSTFDDGGKPNSGTLDDGGGGGP